MGKLLNFAPIPRTTWVRHTTPFIDSAPAERVFVTDRGLRLRAVKGWCLFEHTQVWLVLAPLAGNQVLDGQLEDGSVPTTGQPFQASDWVSDNLQALLLRLHTRGVPGFVGPTGGTMALLDQSAAHQRFLVTHLAKPFVMPYCLTVYSGQDVVDVDGFVSWSDRTNPSPTLQVDLLEIHSGEPVWLDYAAVNQHLTPAPARSSTGWVNVLGGPFLFKDGSAIPFRGRMTCLPGQAPGVGEAPASTEFPDTDGVDPERINSLIAAAAAPALGAERWPDSTWLATGLVPELADASMLDWLGDQALPAFRAWAAAPRGMYAARMFGLARSAGQTGAQQDFGAAKGEETAGTGNPGWLLGALHVAQGEFFRGYCHYEADGSVLRAANHPGCRFFGNYVHFASRPPDTLGKAPVGYFDRGVTGWSDKDLQHYSLLNVQAALALTGDWSLERLLEHQTEADALDYIERIEAPRSVGRLTLAWANTQLLLERKASRELCQQLLRRKVDYVWGAWAGGRDSGPVKVINTELDPRNGIVGLDGQPAPAWKCWEQSIAVLGLGAAVHHLPEPQRSRAADMALALARTIVLYGSFQEAGRWVLCDAVAYLPDGQVLPDTAYATTSRLVYAPATISLWIIPAIRFFRARAAGGPERDRAESILQQFGASDKATTLSTAEWWASTR